ncbi:hypothetical protein Micr_00375 [Candidatus Micrarchaeum sp.]|jgi:hypothetical protein|uniref:hypothetical protein n=1 Tax=Candidatus Micrarchaeum sp. TaxID=2282148 RepID=UPI000929590C|nr:hypothetical protein [Candidatus Micrarchaeum sp.]OJI06695.1 MAG: hypothetical protein BK997_04950 [Candidatus Micrarchaeum sp. ARMAN-1]OJT94204.1 MAG: hypothetical protein JJ59_04530 [Candidatus Micrarchaeum sp. AZ1]OWP53391.1 MAG: hypothetical protein B2I19_02945 [Thermoplasmatales archaeon ARMAN]QRF73850.1 hypothetical protein Micr_00375 [Candidatus Micrarchaeum sp.]
MGKERRKSKKGQSSLELLITLSFGLIILLPIVVLAFIQIATSTSTLATTEAQEAASKLASVAAVVGAQGFPAKQLTLLQVPPDVADIYVGTESGGIGHEVVFVVRTTAGASYVTAYSPVNVTGYLGSLTSQGTYLVNVTSYNSCPSDRFVPCVEMQPS